MAFTTAGYVPNTTINPEFESSSPPARDFRLNRRIIKLYEPADANVVIHHDAYSDGLVFFGVSVHHMRQLRNWSQLTERRRSINNRFRTLDAQTLRPAIVLDAMIDSDAWDSFASLEVLLGIIHNDGQAAKIETVHPEFLAYLAFWAHTLGAETHAGVRQHVARWTKVALAGMGFVKDRRSVNFTQWFGTGLDDWDHIGIPQYVCYLYVAIIFNKRVLFTIAAKSLGMRMGLRHGMKKYDRTGMPNLPLGIVEIVAPVLDSIYDDRLTALAALRSGLDDALRTTANSKMRDLNAALVSAEYHEKLAYVTAMNLEFSLESVITRIHSMHRRVSKNFPGLVGEKKRVNLIGLVKRVVAATKVPEMPVLTTMDQCEADEVLRTGEQLALRSQWQENADRGKYTLRWQPPPFVMTEKPREPYYGMAAYRGTTATKQDNGKRQGSGALAAKDAVKDRAQPLNKHGKKDPAPPKDGRVVEKLCDLTLKMVMDADTVTGQGRGQSKRQS